MPEICHPSFLLPSPLVPLHLSEKAGEAIRLFVKRDDMIHPWLSGNKYRKLKYNIEHARKIGATTLVTFGGPFSNHLYAVAGASAMYGFDSIGLVRGEPDDENPTLRFCRERGMELFFLSREEYRLKEGSPFVRDLLSIIDGSLLLPEGGTNADALPGCREIMDEVQEQLGYSPDYLVLSAGTGGTAAGLLTYPHLKSRIIVLPALRSGHLGDEISALTGGQNTHLLTVCNDYHFGGYAKYDRLLMDFIRDFNKLTGIDLDHVYTAKAMFGLLDLAGKGFFDPGSTVVFTHTGGLQGLAGLEYMLQKKKG